MHLRVETMWEQLWRNRRAVVICVVGAAGFLVLLSPAGRRRRPERR